MYKTLGTSIINSPISPPSLRITSLLVYGFQDKIVFSSGKNLRTLNLYDFFLYMIYLPLRSIKMYEIYNKFLKPHINQLFIMNF